MRILVTGANGQVGWELGRQLEALGDVIALPRQRCDLSHPEQVPAIVRDVKPDVIVNAAAYTAVDKAEQEEELASLINGTAVGVLGEAARRQGALFIHFSTDYVFDGKKAEPYIEDDPTCPINSYGRSKLKGEIALGQIGGDHLVLRTTWVYAARGHNFVQTVLRLARERDELRIVADQVGAPTFARDLARATAQVIEQSTRERRDGRFESGTLHMTGGGAASWYDFARAILDLSSQSEIFRGSMPRLTPLSTEDYPTPAARPKNSRLANDRLHQRFGVSLGCWRESLACCLKEIGTCAR